ncbi:RAB11-binding protein RELCH homolog isoform X1 [Neodiprion virginianus]|uniref:RAB11-binding protein RELCH homolog isoform X1 n=1 Tax=Neodiprion virginianus TaxID=2961670 RepID=UPI001EE6CF25|nr:RAB11-binding protein RELCH homolog isoform X1 [Neodiprion virginianus]
MAKSIEEVEDLFSTSHTNEPVKEDASQPANPTVSYDDIATKLLNERLLLTALEMHAELCEAGSELPILRDYFSNPGNFETQNIKPEPYIALPRSLSQATLDSLDMTRYSEDGGGIDERVAILEFELRKARENISALRANLTVATESEAMTPDTGLDKQIVIDFPIKPHEQRALNYLVNEYLLAHSYKLTSITFSDENENQDFEDWDDVGLNIPKPAQLLQIYREFMRASGHDKPHSANVSVQTEFVQDLNSETVDKDEELKEMTFEIQQLKEQRAVLEREKSELEGLLVSSETDLILGETKDSTGTIQTINSNSSTPEKFEILDSMLQDISNMTQESCGDDTTSVVTSLNETDPGDREWTTLQLPRPDVTKQPRLDSCDSSFRILPANFEREVVTHCVVNTSNPATAFIEDPLRNSVTQKSIIHILTYSLPRIIPNVILNKREETIPLILSAVQLHTNSREREKLLQLLFNLKKRPQEEERLKILAGLVAMAKCSKTSIETGEVLGQCWEQSQHKHLERRLLAAECCSALAPHISGTTRNSLMLSMLQQMLLEDTEPVVRATVVKTLALLVALMDDPDKYFQCEELTLTALDDSSSTVVEAAAKILVPVIAQWALTLGRFQSHLLPRILSKLRCQLKPSHHQNIQNKIHSDGDRAVASINVLQYLLPHTVVCVANTENVKAFVQESKPSDLPDEFSALCQLSLLNPRVFYEGDMDITAVLHAFFANTWENDTWPELEWLSNKLLPDVIDVVKSINVTQEAVLNAFITYIHSLCCAFGRHITVSKIQPIFAAKLTELEQQLIMLTPDRGALSLMLIPAYLTILSTLDVTEVTKALNQFIVAVAISGVSSASLQMAVIRLCNETRLQEHVLNALWDGVVHQRSTVRCATAVLFSSVISHITDHLANTRVAPAIVTLANDTDLTVKAAAIPALAHLVTECGAKEARDKARLTLEMIAREPQGIPSSLAVSLVTALSSIAPNCPQNYTEDVIATQLAGITASALQQARKIELTNSLVEAYSVLVYCPLSNQCITGVLLPGLRYLEVLVNQTQPQHIELVNSLLKEATSRLDSEKPLERSASSSSGLSLAIANVNVGQGVEDMCQRMSKIFQQKSNTPSMANIFRKK